MPEIKYTGHADVRSFTKKDFASHNIDHDAVKFSADNNFTAEVSDEVVDFLASQGEPFVDKDGKKISRSKAAAEDKAEGAEGTGSPDAADASATGSSTPGTTSTGPTKTGKGSSTAGS